MKLKVSSRNDKPKKSEEEGKRKEERLRKGWLVVVTLEKAEKEKGKESNKQQ